MDELVQELRKQKIHMAVVVDEYGGMAGVVTIEDIIEEIVCEIQDEYDSEEPFAQLVGATEAICNARIDVDDVNKLMGIELPTDAADTLGGLIYNELGKVPVVGDRVQVNELSLEVMSVVGRRIKMVRVVNLSPEADAVGLGGRLSLRVIATENSPDIAHRGRERWEEFAGWC